ncbi:MAG: RES family NAD+ phosphorylase [Thiotrichales bacterium]|nr:RES family NAD+ phosphorylase [Thiotrichales bacterium]
MANEEVPPSWHRARIENGAVQFAETDMGAPPPEKAGPGRANPAGIPYLYLASAPETAIAEVRPQKGEVLTVAEFTIEGPRPIIDLRNPRKSITPFGMEDDDILELRENINFLEELGRELSAPVLPDGAAIDYIPSQYLCELIKKLGYHGVVYNSSACDGMNLALFDVGSAKIGGTSRHKITGVSLEREEIPSAVPCGAG